MMFQCGVVYKIILLIIIIIIKCRMSNAGQHVTW